MYPYCEQTRWPTTKQGASDAANEHIQYCHTPEQEKNSTNKTAKLNTCMASAQYQPKECLRQSPYKIDLYT
jgi:hypothetical protein